MKNFIVRIYRCKKEDPRMLVGVVEEVGVKGKKAFTNLDELWDILKATKCKQENMEKCEISASSLYLEKRREARMKKEIPFIFTYKKHNLNASTVDFSRNGLGVKIFEKTPLRVGDVSHLHIKDSNVKAQVRWVDKKSDPSMTMAGFKVVDERLNLRGIKKADAS